MTASLFIRRTGRRGGGSRTGPPEPPFVGSRLAPYGSAGGDACRLKALQACFTPERRPECPVCTYLEEVGCSLPRGLTGSRVRRGGRSAWVVSAACLRPPTCASTGPPTASSC